jgi:hypothetical protein
VGLDAVFLALPVWPCRVPYPLQLNFVQFVSKKNIKKLKIAQVSIVADFDKARAAETG